MIQSLRDRPGVPHHARCLLSERGRQDFTNEHQPTNMSKYSTQSRDLSRRLLSSCAFLLSLLVTRASTAETRIEIQGGPSYMDNNSAAAIFVEAMGGGRGIGLSDMSLQPVASLGWIDGRNVARYDGTRYSAQRDTEVIAGGARLHAGGQQAWYRRLFFGFELAYNQQATRALSSHYEFMSSLGWQGKRFSFQLRHISNGGIHDPNRGETMALVGMGFGR
jgi:hypothetical protein